MIIKKTRVLNEIKMKKNYANKNIKEKRDLLQYAKNPFFRKIAEKVF